MGDGGAMFLGFLMATLSLKLRLENPSYFVEWATPVLVLGAAIFDTTLVTISRSRRGLLPFTTPGKDHAAHRLANLGLGQRGAVLSIYMLGAISAERRACKLPIDSRSCHYGSDYRGFSSGWRHLSGTSPLRTPGYQIEKAA